ncbi:KH domain-containing protein [Candidatus Gottesmanbacteria bacterium]|nr:KH domain-containing protein [Candidatus Gottesmanbacteria bacterium]
MRKTKSEDSIAKEVKSTLASLLEKLRVEGNCTVTKESPDHYKAIIETQESGLLIGRHGETLNSLQLILGVILYKKLKSWVRVVLDVGNYRQAREEDIKEMVNRIASEVDATGKPVILPYLSPLERRIVHLMLSDHQKVTSESSGEGRNRRITLKLR